MMLRRRIVELCVSFSLAFIGSLFYRSPQWYAQHAADRIYLWSKQNQNEKSSMESIFLYELSCFSPCVFLCVLCSLLSMQFSHFL